MQIVRRRPTKTTVVRQGRARKGDGSLKLRGRTWWYIIPDPLSPGKRIEKSCETDDYQQAVIEKHNALIRARSPGALRRQVPATINDVMDSYAKYAEKECPRSWKSLRCSINHLRKAFGRIPADTLTTADTDQFRDDRIGDDEVGDSTVNRELGYLRAAMRQEMKFTQRVTKIPYMRTPSEKDNVREGFIERADYEKILAALPFPVKAIFVCAFHTGARSGELKQIQWPQVNFDHGLIELRPKTTKNSDGRWIPIWGDMREYLLKQKELRDRTLPDCPWAFFWPEGYHPRATPGERLRDFRWAWAEAVTAAGYPDLLFHDLRRSAIKYADQDAAINSGLVRLMSGHKTESVYDRYNIRGAKEAMEVGKKLNIHLAGAEIRK